MLQPGDVLRQRYRIEKEIGGGGFGKVHLAFDLIERQSVAIKELVPDPTAPTDVLDAVRKQFRKEASILQNLSHPNLAKVFASFSENGNEYIVMQYIEGEDLQKAIQKALQLNKPIGEGAIRAWIYQVLEALAYLHSRNILHRDIKPANIILQNNGHIVLVDFGLVKLMNPSNPNSYSYLHSWGTMGYAPPEQFMPGMHTNPSSDIYSLSATLQNLFTCKDPLPVPPRPLRQGVSDNMQSVVEKGQQFKPSDRFQSAKEMHDELLQWKSQQTQPAPIRRNPPSAPNHFVRYFAIGTLSLLAIIFAGLVMFPNLGNNSTQPTVTRPNTLLPISPTTIAKITLTSTPTFTTTATRTTTFTPTRTATANPTATSTLVPPTATVRPITVSGEFAPLWQRYPQLGAPLERFQNPQQFKDMAEQWFDKGHMFGTGDMGAGTKQIIVVREQDGNRWWMYQDNWVSGNNAPCAQANQAAHQVIRGFGKVWCEQQLWNLIGYAKDIERGKLLLIQRFENGIIFRDSDGYTKHLAYVFFKDGTFTREPY